MVSLADYNLSANPFPGEVGIPSEIVTFWADRKEIKEKIFNLIDEINKSKKSSIISIYGDYGQGKSHTLKYITNYVNEKYGVEALCIYIDSPVILF
jgi:DNA replication protein DnaC